MVTRCVFSFVAVRILTNIFTDRTTRISIVESICCSIRLQFFSSIETEFTSEMIYDISFNYSGIPLQDFVTESVTVLLLFLNVSSQIISLTLGILALMVAVHQY